MSAGNFQQEKKRNYQLRAKRVNEDYTIKTGTSTFNGIIDNPVCIYNPAADIALTLSDGSYIGQEQLVVVEANTSDKDAVLTVTTSASASEDVITLEDAGEYIWFIWTGTAWDMQNYVGCSLA